MKIVSWNVNGLRTRIVEIKNGKIVEGSSLSNLISSETPDYICFQETRCSVENAKIFKNDKYPFQYYNESKGIDARGPNRYSGTAIWSVVEPISVEYQIPNYNDTEGRIIILTFPEKTLINVYTPNSGTNEAYRIGEWDPAIKQYLTDLILTGKNIIFAGDMNVCHHELDIFSGFPSNSIRIAGLLPEERSAFNQYIDIGLRDPYRELYPDEDEAFTWWNPRIKKFREANKGWRIDYYLIPNLLSKNIINSEIRKDITGSDHCPITLDIDLDKRIRLRPKLKNVTEFSTI